MTDRHDGSSIDLEKAVVRYMVERRITRRYLLERIALVGSAAALAPIIAACTSSAASPSAAPSSAASSRIGGVTVGRRLRRPRSHRPRPSSTSSTGPTTWPTT